MLLLFTASLGSSFSRVCVPVRVCFFEVIYSVNGALFFFMQHTAAQQRTGT